MDARIKRCFSVLAAIVFAVALWVPLLQMWSGVFPEMRFMEKRMPASKPDAKRITIKSFPKYLMDYEKYFNDTFGFRNNLIQFNNILNVKYLGKAHASSEVYLGNEGWLYYQAKDGIGFRDYCGTAPFSAVQLERIKKRLESDYKRFREKGINYLLVIAPNKHTIYPEHLPSRLVRVSPKTRLDQLMECLEGSEVPVLDLRAPLLEAKADYPVYFKTDTHWNHYGAFIAYQAIISSLSKVYPDFCPRPLGDFEMHVREVPGNGGEANMLGIPGVLRDVNIVLVGRFPFRSTACTGSCKEDHLTGGRPWCIKEQHASDLPRLLMYHDSFLSPLHTYLPEHFSRSTFIHHKYLTEIDSRVEEEKPDVVIIEIVERFLGFLDYK